MYVPLRVSTHILRIHFHRHRLRIFKKKKKKAIIDHISCAHFNIIEYLHVMKQIVVRYRSGTFIFALDNEELR